MILPDSAESYQSSFRLSTNQSLIYAHT